MRQDVKAVAPKWGYPRWWVTQPMRIVCLLAVLAVALSCCTDVGVRGWGAEPGAGATLKGTLPGGQRASRVPYGMGVQLPRALASDAAAVMAAAKAGFRFARNDMDWELVDKGDGIYDFATYDREVALADAHGVRMVYILISHAFIARPDDSRWNVRTENGRLRFAAFAGAAARHFKGKGIVWEIWNEPDGGFWKPRPSVDEFFPLLVASARAIRRADVEAVIIAPGSGHAIHPLTGDENAFLKSLLDRGALQYVDAVSVHPYQAGGKPENAARGYEKLREWIRKDASLGREAEIVSSEWGYEDFIGWKDVGYVRQRQARFVVRAFLVNLWQGIPLSVYFTYRASKSYGLLEDDGASKPAWAAASTMLNTLQGMRYVGRVFANDGDEFVLRFADGQRQILAAWLGVDARGEGASLETRRCLLPLPAGKGELVSIRGQARTVRWGSEGLRLVLSEEPQYLFLSYPQGESGVPTKPGQGPPLCQRQ